MTSVGPMLIERWADPAFTSLPGWTDALGRSPVGLYIEYLIRRRRWEEGAIKVGGSHKPAFKEHLGALEDLHQELSVAGPIEDRDTSVAKPPTRDPRKVKLVSVEWSDDRVVLRTLEEEFEDLLPVAYKVEVIRSGDRWALRDRVTEQGSGRRLHLL